MSISFQQLFLANLRMVYRNSSGLFWTVVMPLLFYVVFASFRLERFVNVGSSYASFFLPGLLAYIFMQGGLYGLGYFLTDLRAKGVIKRFLVTPIRPFEMALAVVSARIVVMFIQLLLLVLVGIFVFNASFALASTPIVLLVTFIGGSLFLSLGLLVSTLASSYESAAPITAGIGLPLLFLGDVFYPLALLPRFLEALGKILPLSHLSAALRMSFSGNIDWSQMAVHLAVLVAWLLALLLIIRFRFKLEE